LAQATVVVKQIPAGLILVKLPELSFSQAGSFYNDHGSDSCAMG